jgi:hypothetical protein
MSKIKPNGDEAWRPVTLPQGVSRQGLAAFCLWEQEFGFTRNDVAGLRELMNLADGLADNYEVTGRAALWLKALADRIEALLPEDGECVDCGRRLHGHGIRCRECGEGGE